MKRDTINGNLSHIVYYSNSQVRQNGRIFPWGGFRIITDGVTDDPVDNTSGCYCWCEQLMKYPTEQYMVHIDFDNLLIKKRHTGDIVETLPLYGEVVEVFVPDVQFLRIDANRMLEDMSQTKSDEGDGNHFFIFDQRYIGMVVIKLAFHGFLKAVSDTVVEDYIFLTPEGKKVPFTFTPEKTKEECLLLRHFTID